MKANKLVDLAKKLEKQKTIYMWGTWINQVTNDLISRKVKQYPSKNKSREKKYKDLVGKNVLAVDCCGLIKGIGWGWEPDKLPKYVSNAVKDQGADSMINSCIDISTDFSKIEVGCVVWLSGHIGIYIGDGLAIEATPKWKDGVQITAVENIGKKSGYNARKWTKHGKLPWVDYVKDVEPKPPTIKPPASGGSTGSNYITHIVKKGETLWGISQKYLGAGKYYTLITRYNDLHDATTIYPNQKLKIPLITAGKEIIHVVVKGETLSGISKRYFGVTSQYTEIAKRNNLTNPNKISIGQKLIIPLKK